MKPAYTQNINPQLGGFTQGYPTGVSLNELTYQSPGFLNTNVPAIQQSAPYRSNPITYGNNASNIANLGYSANQSIPGHSPHQTVLLGNRTTGQTHNILGHSHVAGSVGANIVNLGTAAGTGISTVQQLGTVGLQGYSQIEYIPYESYYIDYQQQQFIQNIIVPVQRKVTDYYAVEHVVDYIPKQIEETVIDMVPEEKVTQKLYYVPVETQMIHMPKGEHTIHSHGQKITTEVRGQNVVTPGSQVGQNRIISRPIERVVSGGNAIQGATIPVPQVQVKPPVITTPPPVVQPQQIHTHTVGQINTVPLPTVAPQVRPPVGGAGQFKQSPATLQANQALVEKQLNLPQNAKMQYQYSTRTVRTLAPGEKSITTPTATIGQPTATLPPQFSTQTNQFQPVLGQPASRNIQSNQPLLANNRTVDLADSEHINITKSVYNATYNNSTSVGQNNYSFGANRNSGGSYNPTVVNTVDPLANRISGGSVYDYDQLRDY